MGLKAGIRVPSLFVSELPSVRLGGALSLGGGGDFGPWTRSQVASPDFLPCPYLGLWERLLSLASLHPRVRNYSETPSCSQAPHWVSKQNLWKQISGGSFGHTWQLPVSTVHQQALSPRHSPLQMHMKPGRTLSLRHIQERSAQELVDAMFFFWLHPNQMELNICIPTRPFIADTGSQLCSRAVGERLFYLLGLTGVPNLCFFPDGDPKLKGGPAPLMPSSHQSPCLQYLDLPSCLADALPSCRSSPLAVLIRWARLLQSRWHFLILWTVACQAPLSMGFSRQEYCSGLPRPPPGDLPSPGIESTSPVFPAWQVGFLPLTLRGSPLFQ